MIIIFEEDGVAKKYSVLLVYEYVYSYTDTYPYSYYCSKLTYKSKLYSTIDMSMYYYEEDDDM